MMEKCTPLYNQKTMCNESNSDVLVDEAKDTDHPTLQHLAEPHNKASEKQQEASTLHTPNDSKLA